MSTVYTHNIPDEGLPLRAGLWLAQVLLAGVYLPTGIVALALPASQVLTLVPWASHLSGAMLTFFGAVNVAAGLGVLLPSLTRVGPSLTVIAAVCSAILQVFAMFFYAILGGLAVMLPVILTVFTLSVLVAWGRSDKASITPRWQGRRMSDVDAFVSAQVKRSGGRAGLRLRAIRRRKSGNDKGFQIQRGLRGALFHRAKVQRRLCNE
ncbi:MAG: hypothetical protein L0H37_02600 [Nitrosospira sp.]|nr:hypothetical protein [Nitrosospira sp.]